MLTYGRLLMTGAAGKIGRHLRQTLKPYCQTMVLTDIAPMSAAGDCEEVYEADIADEKAVLELMRGVDAVVHLAGIIVERPFHEILGPNIIGSYNLWEAARSAGAKRIVYASSCHAVGMYRRDERLDASVPQRPDSFYGLSKAFTEDLARLYFDRHGIEAACLRIGSCLPEPVDARMLATWLSPDDMSRLCAACLTAPYLGYAVVYGASDNPQSWWDNAGVDYLGYRPKDSAETFRESIMRRTEPLDRDDPRVVLQAGPFAKGLNR